MDSPTSFTDTYAPTPTRSGVSWRTLWIALLVMLVGGGALGGWLMWDYAGNRPAASIAPDPLAADLTLRARPAATTRAAPPAPLTPPTPLAATEAGTLATRISLLEDRLARVSVAADGASGNAAKAEAMLLALAARRALDRGLPLGVLEAPLRLRFGESQPVAVDAIIAAGRAPVTETELAEQLIALRARLDSAPDASILDRIRSGIDSLIVIRPNDTPSPTAGNRFARAQAALARGRIDLALVEVEAMRGAAHADVAAWLRRARLRNDASRALDLIESAAILEPGASRDETPVPATTRR